MSNTNTADYFFDRAEKEARRYGRDPWVLLRELVQNSRDAGARHIQILADEVSGYERLTCIDDGVGMSEEDFSSYFLRLYASSKETNQDAVGFFGVGFWSVLLFEPEIIQVTTVHHGQAMACEIDVKARELKQIYPEGLEEGTRIYLLRKAQTQEGDFADLVAERLSYYTAHVRPAGGVSSLTLTCNGVSINAPLPVPRDLGRRFRTRRFEGSLGFGPEPLVRIYKGGILIRDLSGLNEVIPSREPKVPQNWGLFPNVYLNGEGFEVLMDRRLVYEDPLLHEAVDYCENELAKLNKQLIKGLLPMDLRNRILGLGYWAKSGTARMTALVILLMALLFVGLRIWAPSLLGDPIHESFITGERLQTVDDALSSWGGSIIDSPAGSGYSWDFTYTPVDQDPLFRMGTFARFDQNRGFFPDRGVTLSDYPSFVDRNEERYQIEMGVSRDAGRVILPVPPGFVLLKSSLGSLEPNELTQNPFGEPVLQLSPARSRVNYTVIKRDFPILPPPVTGINVDFWPAEYQDLANTLSSLSTSDAAALVTRHIKNNFKYSEDPIIADQFRVTPGTWLEKTLAVQSGDCDILNGLFVLLMRAGGHQAFLSIGLVGNQGQAEPTLHAWARYYDRGWRSLDLTVHAGQIGINSFPPLGPSPSGTPMTGPAENAPDGNRVIGEPNEDGEDFPTVGPNPFEDEMPEAMDSEEDWLVRKLPLLIGAVTVLAILALLLRRRISLGKRPDVDKPAFVADLFQHYFLHGAKDDPLMLGYRPVFPLLDGRKLSLNDLQKRARMGALLVGEPGSRLQEQIRGKQSILDGSSYVVKTLAPFLPSLTRLSDLEPIMDRRPLHPVLNASLEVIRRLDPVFAIHQMAGSDQFMEAPLPLVDKSLGDRHVLIGEQHPFFQELTRPGSADGNVQTFRAVQMLLNKTTFYLNEKDAFLETLAQNPSSIGGRR